MALMWLQPILPIMNERRYSSVWNRGMGDQGMRYLMSSPLTTLQALEMFITPDTAITFLPSTIGRTHIRMAFLERMQSTSVLMK